jgi:hypothetical protein
MSIRVRAGVTGLTVATCTAVGLLVPAAVASAAPASPHNVTVTMSKSGISFGNNNRIAGGTTIFKIVAVKGQHDLQLVQLHKGYSLQQAGSDINKAFNGNVPAVNRLDKNATLLGGAGGSPGHPGYFAVRNLSAGTYYAFDTDANNVVTKLTVVGNAPTVNVPYNAYVAAFTYGFDPIPNALPSSGWLRFYNHSDQPHMLVIQAVKPSTTTQDVQKYVNSGGQGNPSWGLPFSTGIGVISPNIGMTWKYALPKGKYLLMCFWPDDKTGMPHFLMGMWRLVVVK